MTAKLHQRSHAPCVVVRAQLTYGLATFSSSGTAKAAGNATSVHGNDNRLLPVVFRLCKPTTIQKLSVAFLVSLPPKTAGQSHSTLKAAVVAAVNSIRASSAGQLATASRSVAATTAKSRRHHGYTETAASKAGMSAEEQAAQLQVLQLTVHCEQHLTNGSMLLWTSSHWILPRKLPKDAVSSQRSSTCTHFQLARQVTAFVAGDHATVLLGGCAAVLLLYGKSLLCCRIIHNIS